MPSRLLATRCFNHPGRPAVAICVSCGKAVCASCSTPWEGMHHCISCLAARRAAAGDRRAAVRSIAVAILAVAAAVAVTLLRAVAGALLARVF
jgi:hypothetical protein